MRRICLSVVLFLVPFTVRAADSAAQKGDLYLLGFGVDQGGAPRGKMKQVGSEANWNDVRLGAVVKGWLYTIEADDSLQATDPESGLRTRVGQQSYKDITLLLAAGDRLCALDKAGNLFRINPINGACERVGTEGAWKAVRAAVVLGSRLFTIENDTLHASDLGGGTRMRLGKADLKDVAFLFAAGDRLHIINKAGDLCQVNPADGARAPVGRPGAWKAVRAAVVRKGLLYTVEADGSLHATDPATGMRARIGPAKALGNVSLLFAADESLYAIRDGGSLFSVQADPGRIVDQYNFMPLGFEKAFREQGGDFYRHMHVRQILGQFATHAELMDGLAWLRRHAKPNDLVLMFVACHGSCTPKGESIFATLDGVIVRPRDIKKELAQLPCHAIYVDDACQSGGWPRDLPGDPLPPNVSALCCCLETQNSNNEFDVALFEALHGRADFNHDGVVDLDEVIRYCALRVKEIQGGRLTPVMRKARNLRGPVPLTKVAPNLVSVLAKGEIYSALLGKQDGDRYQVHVIGWDAKPGMPYTVPTAVTRDYLCLPADGPPLRVQKGGRWHPARLLGREGDDYKVRYLGPKASEEVVTEERVRPVFSAKPGELGKSYRYNAACAAALAGAGKGPAAAGLTAAGRANLCQQALEGLRAELAARTRLLKGDRFAAPRVHEDLRYWLSDPDLAGVREAAELARHGEAERVSWQDFWRRVASLDAQARESYTEVQHQGKLGPQNREENHSTKMTAGKTYVIDLVSPQFDTLLRLHDDAGKVLAENDDISKDNLNSRIVFTATGDGSYRVVATSFRQRGAGAYTLTIREFTAKKN
jgi:hypothetical protein